MKWLWSRVKRQVSWLLIFYINMIELVKCDLPALTAIADQFRDQQLWDQATRSYDEALARNPTLAAIWVQFGHTCKEAGNITAAERAYRRALAIKPDDADCYLQLGHVLKLQGRKPAAIAAYAKALRVDRGFPAAMTELVALGEGPWAGEVNGFGEPMLHELLGMIQTVRQTLQAIEDRLPDVASLARISMGQYDVFRRKDRLTAPPPVTAARNWVCW